MIAMLPIRRRRDRLLSPHLFKALALVWTAAHPWTILWIMILVVQGLLPAATIYLTRFVVDGLVQVVGAGVSWASLQPVLLPAGLMAGVLLLTELVQAAANLVGVAQAELVQDHVSRLIHQQSIALDFGCYESSEYNDQLSRAREGAAGRSLATLQSLGSLLQSSITLLAVAAILVPYGLWLPIVLVGSAFPAFYVLLRVNRLQYRWSQQTTTDRRWLMYYELLLTNSATAAELRLFNFGPHFISVYQRLRQRLRQEQLQLTQTQALGRLTASLLSLLVLGAALAWMGYQILLGAVTLGDLALFYQAFNRGQGIVKSILSNLGQIYKNNLFLGNLFEFLTLQPAILDPPRPVAVPEPIQQGICFRSVTFRYPGSREAVLANFNLEIPARKVVALVGDNGAGKSTLIKLLCRFYDPQEGQIEIDGIDLRDLAIAALRQQMTVLFQNPIPYYMTARENIALSQIATPSSDADMIAAAQAAGIHDPLMQLPNGYETMLGKLFPEGTDLSGGEWQRLALARAFLRKAPLIILDEPTSAMDPWAEFDWLERFRTLAADRTALVITHRFPLAMRADVIHVMKAGQIVESGNHAELLKLNGLYAQSWRSQMQAGEISPEQGSSSSQWA